MKKEVQSICLWFSMCLLGVAGAPALAQTGPSGTNQITVSDPNNLVWDLSALTLLNKPIIYVDVLQTSTQVRYAWDAITAMGPGGKVAGSGTTNIDLSYYSPYVGSGSTNFIGAYKASASTTSSKGMAKGTLSFSVSGKAWAVGELRSLKGASTMSFTINNFSNSVATSTKSSASLSGLGSVSAVAKSGSETITNSGMGNGYWVMDLALATTGKVVTGSVAKVTLNKGRVMNFTPKGTFTAKTQVTKLVLTGVGEAKGSSLQVEMSGSGTTNVIKAVKGKLLGQTIALRY